MDLLIKQPQRPAIDRRTGDLSGDGPTEQPEASPLSTPPAAAAAPATVEPGDEAGSSSNGSQAREGDGKPAPLPNSLTEEGRELADRFRAKRAQPDCSELELGLDLVDIFRNRRLPVKGSRILDSEQLLGLDRFEVRRLVELAEGHRAEHGGGSPARSAEVRPTGASASKQQPANAGRPTIPTHRVGGSPAPSNAAGGEDANETAPPAHAAAADGGSTASASISSLEQKSGARKKQRAARQTSTPVNGEHPDCSIQPAIELPPPVAPEPAGADAKSPQHPTGGSVTPPAETQNKKRQKVIKQAASKSMADTQLAPTKQAERLHDLEAIVDRGIETVFEVGAALEEIRDHELFSPQFKTFGEYLQQRWGWSRARCYQLIGATKVRDNLSTRVDIAHLSEPHCRVLAKLKHADQVTAWNDAASAAPDGKVTLAHLKKAVAKLLPPAQPMPPDEAPATAAPAVEAEEATPDHALPAETHEEPTTDQPESPPAIAPAAFATDEFDLDAEWLVVEQIITSMFQRCPKYKRQVLWRHLNAYSEQKSELIPVD